MSQSMVDSGALKLAIDVLKRNAGRHGQPSMLEVAQELEKTAVVMSSRTCENCKHFGAQAAQFDEEATPFPIDFHNCTRIAVFDISGDMAYSELKITEPHIAKWEPGTNSFRVPKDHYCKLWEKKNERSDS